jgi:hypothetical protein
MPVKITMDDDAMLAAVDLVGRTGATAFQLGYLHENKPIEEAGWYAHAQYQGTRITEEDHRGPVEAAEALARRLLNGARCNGCGKLVALSGAGAFAYSDATLTDGTRWNAEDAAKASQCRWTRFGQKWKAACQ